MLNKYSKSLSILIFTILSGCDLVNSDVETIEKSRNHLSRPEKSNDGWNIGTLEGAGVNRQLMVDLVHDVNNGKFSGISSILLVKDGQLIVEEYFGEAKMNKLHTMRSASKAVTSALVGIAIEQGYIESEEAKVLPYFPEYEGLIKNWDERKRRIKLKHILSMTSGIKGNEDAMYPTNDWIKFYFDQPVSSTPGKEFSYATSGVVVLGSVITRTSGLRIPEFTNKYLFEPLGIHEYRWPITNSLGNQGLAMTGGGLKLKSRDMAKFGQLYLNNGIWEGQRIISRDWVEKSTTKQATSDYQDEDFGYLWRMIDRNIKGTSVHSFEAWGNGGQFIMVFPELKLVAVFTGENYGKFPEMEQPFKMIDRYILPAIIQEN
ncbi:serine hydrolase [Aliikangiella sp. G2MR2-5]|uniref:serine hydrolase domain-containing protein n=1 Tax=Aliikangiella sp. G2MR2-5 TaxID=2788943 RepID=UPI0018AC1792|nr:serine hydrolase [Aliikangiella sp. G2MR2-5]